MLTNTCRRVCTCLAGSLGLRRARKNRERDKWCRLATCLRTRDPVSQPTDLSVGREGRGASGGSDPRCERVRKSRRGGGGAGLTGKLTRDPWVESRCEEPRHCGEFART